MSIAEPVIRIINSNNIVENGALIVVTGAKNSGKTCIVENAIFYSLQSFSATKFPPLYYGKSPESGAKYFGKLFGDYLSHSNSSSGANERRAAIWQLGYQQEYQDALFRRQGEEYINSQLPLIIPRQRKPRLLFFFDDCDRKEDIDYACQCLAYTKDHRLQQTISLVETSDMFYLGQLEPQIVIFTSRLDVHLHVGYFRKLLKCRTSVANDLIETANTFIEPCKVALLINLHQWVESNHVRGLFIYEYELVPPLDEELAKRRRINSSSSDSNESSHITEQQVPKVERHRRRHRRHRRSDQHRI